MKHENFLDKIGNTPLVKFGQYGDAVIWLKLEGENPTGSLKDRSAKAIILDKIEKGELTSDKHALDASSGSFACAVAYICALLGYQATLVANSKLTGPNEKFIRYFGGNIVKHGDVTREGYEKCLEMVRSEPERWCFLDQLNNWKSVDAHREGTAKEIFQELEPVLIAGSMGSGAHLCGISQFIADNQKKTKLAASIAGPGKKIAGTWLEGSDYISPFINALWDNHAISIFSEVTYEEAQEQAKRLAAKGFFVGLQTGGVFKAALRAIEELNLAGNIVVVSGDTGWKNLDKILA